MTRTATTKRRERENEQFGEIGRDGRRSREREGKGERERGKGERDSRIYGEERDENKDWTGEGEVDR